RGGRSPTGSRGARFAGARDQSRPFLLCPCLLQFRRGRMKAGIIAALGAGLVLALSASPALAINASDVAPCRPGLPQQLRTLKGLFTVHVVCDHVLYEIPLAMLDRDMLLTTEFAALSTGTEKLAPGAVVENRLVRWTRRGNKVYMEAVTYEMRAPNMPRLPRGVEPP